LGLGLEGGPKLIFTFAQGLSGNLDWGRALGQVERVLFLDAQSNDMFGLGFFVGDIFQFHSRWRPVGVSSMHHWFFPGRNCG